MALEDIQAAQDRLLTFSEAGAQLSKNTIDAQQELIQAALMMSSGRNLGLSDQETIQLVAQKVLQQANENRKTNPRAPGVTAQMAEQLLKREGMGMNEDDMKSSSQIAREEGDAYGYGDEKSYNAANSGDSYNKLDSARASLRRARNRGDQSAMEKIGERIEGLEEGAKSRDFGVGLSGDDYITGDDAAQRQVGRTVVRNPGTPQEARVFVQGGKDYATAADAPAVVDLANPVARTPVVNPGTPTERNERAAIGKRRDRQEGLAAKIQDERFFRGDLTPEEMENEARLKAGRQVNNPGSALRGIGITMEDVQMQMPPSMGSRTVRIPRGVPDPNASLDEVQLRVHPGVQGAFNVDSAQAAVLQQLQARKARGQAGNGERMARENRARAESEAIQNIASGQVRTPDITGLGKAYLGGMRPAFTGEGVAFKGGSDLGVVLGKQRPIGNAVTVERPDGSYYYVDSQTGNLAGNVQLGPQQQVETTATGLNAPQSVGNAREFIDANIFDNYGAQSFGDETVLNNLMINEDLGSRGSGGGIPQVDISGETGAFAAAVQKKLGLPMAPRMRSAEDLQGAVDEYIRMQGGYKGKGKKKFYRMEDGKQVYNSSPGIAEVMHDLRMTPAQQQQFANALYQLEQAKASGINLDRKADFYEGRSYTPDLGQYSNVVFDVNDPAKGGDRLEIAKAPANVQARFRKADDADAAKPFVGQLAGAKPQDGINDVQVYDGIPAEDIPQLMRLRNDRAAAKNPKRKRDLAKEEQRIRKMVGGNIMARNRAAAAEAARQNEDVNVMGRVFKRSALNEVQEELLARTDGAPRMMPDPPVKRQAIENASVSPTISQDPGAPTGPANEIMKALNTYRTDPKYQRGRRIGYGIGGGVAGVGALAALISGEREQREEEVMV